MKSNHNIDDENEVQGWRELLELAIIKKDDSHELPPIKIIKTDDLPKCAACAM